MQVCVEREEWGVPMAGSRVGMTREYFEDGRQFQTVAVSPFSLISESDAPGAANITAIF